MGLKHASGPVHFTGTDFIDGVSNNSIGTRQGDGRNDRFLFTSFSVGYTMRYQAQEKVQAHPHA